MGGKRAAIRYAKAILSLAEEKSLADVVHNDMKLMSNAIEQSKELADVLDNSVVKISDKKEVLLKVFPTVNDLTKELFNVLSNNKRIDILHNVARSYDVLFQEQSGKQKAIVTTAFPITEELTQKVLEKAKQFTSKTIELQNVVNEEILGGFILRIGDLQYNASVANKLNRLKREFTLN